MSGFFSTKHLVLLCLVHVFSLKSASLASVKSEPVSSKESLVGPSHERISVTPLKAGQGKTVEKGHTVEIHYKGYFTNGATFDSSKGKAFGFTLNGKRAIPGIEQAVIGMKVGERRRVTIPPSLAYGKKGLPDLIPPDTTLIFDLEVINLIE